MTRYDARQAITKYLADYPGGFDRDGAMVLDQNMMIVLRRLADSDRACVAIGTVASSDEEIQNLLDHVMDAERLMREFPVVLVEESATVNRLEQHRNSVEDLKVFIEQASKWPEHFSIGWVAVDEDEKNSLHGALDRIVELIEQRQQTAEIAITDLGVNRKARTPAAAQNAAIADLAQSVQIAFDKTFASEIAVLSEVAFDIGEITEDRVRQISKARRQRRA